MPRSDSIDALASFLLLLPPELGLRDQTRRQWSWDGTGMAVDLPSAGGLPPCRSGQRRRTTFCCTLQHHTRTKIKILLLLARSTTAISPLIFSTLFPPSTRLYTREIWREIWRFIARTLDTTIFALGGNTLERVLEFQRPSGWILIDVPFSHETKTFYRAARKKLMSLISI